MTPRVRRPVWTPPLWTTNRAFGLIRLWWSPVTALAAVPYTLPLRVSSSHPDLTTLAVDHHCSPGPQRALMPPIAPVDPAAAVPQPVTRPWTPVTLLYRIHTGRLGGGGQRTRKLLPWSQYPLSERRTPRPVVHCSRVSP